MFNRVAKPVSAAAALISRRLISVARTLSGIVVLLRRKRGKPALKTAPPDRTPKTTATPDWPRTSKHSEWDQWVQTIVSLAKQEIAEILPCWSIDIHTFESTCAQCYEFVLRAETPQHWSHRLLGPDGHLVPGRPKQEWGGLIPVPFREILTAPPECV